MLAHPLPANSKNNINGFDITALPKLGAGLLYNPALTEYLKEHTKQPDYISVIPDMFYTDDPHSSTQRFKEIELWMNEMDWLKNNYPLVAHNIGFSLASADIFDSAYLMQITDWCKRFNFKWHSDHLSFVKVKSQKGSDHNAGMAVPFPYDKEMLDIILSRVQIIQEEIPIPFLLENNVFFIDFPEQEMNEAEFLNTLTAQSQSGILLDIHNVYANAINHNFDAKEFILQLDLSRVVEIHIAGGNEMGGFYTDSHAGPCPPEVWNLLDFTVPLTPNLGGITFEFHESYFPLLKFDGITATLQQAKDIWNKNH